ncbi:MAG: ABC transporter permease [Eubacterium sp.]|nr:ABC transporter permease [Eubacterium sp.]
MAVLSTIISLFPRAVMQGIPILYGATGEIMTEKSGNLNLGIPGIMYIGGISGVIGAFLYENAAGTGNPLNGFLAIFIPLICTIIGSLIAGLIYCFLTVTLRANQNVTGLALTTFGVGFGNFFGASLIKLVDSDVPSVALSRTSAFFATKLPFAGSLGVVGKLFFSYGFLAYAAIIIAIICAFFLNKTRGGLHLRAVGENPATADAAGISVTKSKYLATCIGSVIAGLGGLYYVMDYANGVWSNEGFGDRGWLAIALVIFAIWRPNLGIFASIIFGGLYIVYLFVPGLTLKAQELFKMLPYIVTIIVLVAVSIRKKKENQPPEALGLSYFREER